jgi:CDP-diacylglycerol---glycerol-3-phosphate 3-phosphatidyltransferase
MSLYRLKPRFQAMLRPAVEALARAGVTANQVTIAAALGSVAIGVLVAANADHRAVFLLLPAWLFVRMALNAIDGVLAREFRQKSALGAYLNEIGDVVSDAALALPFTWLAPFGPFWTGLVVVLSLASEYAGVLGPMVGASRRYDGPLGKSDRALVFGALAAWIGLGFPLFSWFAGLMPVLTVLLAVTIVNRVRAGLREASRPMAQG